MRIYDVCDNVIKPVTSENPNLYLSAYINNAAPYLWGGVFFIPANIVYLILKLQGMEHSEQNIVSDIYNNYHETQKEILAIDLRKTRNKLITIALVIFIFDLLAILAGNLVTLKHYYR